MVNLREINNANFNDVINLSVFEEQKEFVASNTYSLAQAKVYPECKPLAIYNDDTLVGFVMYGTDSDDNNENWISRLMIDRKYQKMGYGKAAMECVMSIIMSDKEHDKVYISFEPENTGAKILYEQFGFIPDGRVLEGEIVYCFTYGHK